MNGVRKSGVSFFTRCALVTLCVFGAHLRVHAVTVFSADFEDGVGGYSSDGFTYTADPDASSNLWHATTHRSASPTHCQYYGLEGVFNYDTIGTRNAGNLDSPSISLASVSPPITLSFNYLLQTENFAPFDLATVQISINGGGSWTTLATLGDSPSFTMSNIDLSAYFGTTIKLRFNFDTFDEANNAFEGWYIDDVSITGAAAQSNNWATAASGKWEIGGNWSVGTPSSSDTADLITNATSKTVTIDPATTLSNSLNQCLSIANLIISAPAGTANTLQLINPGTSIPLKISNGLTVNSGGAILVTNFALQVSGLTSVGAQGSGTMTLRAGAVTITSNLVLGATAGATGTLWVTGGTFTMTNPPNTTIVGIAGDGQIVVSNGAMSTRGLLVGTNQFSHGTITVAGGSLIASNVVLGVASNSTAAVWVTGGELVTTNRALTLGSFGNAQLTVSNGATFRNFVLFMANRTPSSATFTVAGGNASMNTLIVGAGSNTTATVWLTGGGQLLNTNIGLNIAPLQSIGQMTISNGTFLTRDPQIASGNSSVGTLTMHAGTLTLASALSSNCFVGLGVGSKGAVWINGGQVTMTNNLLTTFLGVNGPGQWTLSNGTVTVANLIVGIFAEGSLTVAGGTFTITTNMLMGLTAVTTTVSVTGGQLLAPDASLTVGNAGVSPLTVSGTGLVLARSLSISPSFSDGHGSLNIPAGQVTVFDSLVVGDCASNAFGQITVNGGTLIVTNAAHTGYIDLRGGTLTVNSGIVVVDRLVMTNACGHFVRTGGSLSITSTNLGAGLDADGDGLPNDWERE